MKALAWLSLLVVACSKGGERPAAQSQSADTGMADMPGMTATTAVTLTAAQVTHGGVHWEPVATSTVASIATVPGQVIPNEDRTARLGATVRGRVIAVRVRPGDRVSAGHVLVTLQSPEAGMAQSDVEKARAQASYARSARERAERRLALKAIPQQDYDRAIADDELASAELGACQLIIGDGAIVVLLGNRLEGESALRSLASTACVARLSAGFFDVGLRHPRLGALQRHEDVSGADAIPRANPDRNDPPPHRCAEPRGAILVRYHLPRHRRYRSHGTQHYWFPVHSTVHDLRGGERDFLCRRHPRHIGHSGIRRLGLRGRAFATFRTGNDE